MNNVEFLVDMGFPEDKACLALSNANGNMQKAMDLLLTNSEETGGSLEATDHSSETTHQNLESADAMPGPSGESSDPMPTEDAAEVAKSIKCDECEKLFKDATEVEFHAAKTGHTAFSESVEEKKPMTAEEKQQKLRGLEEKMKQRRAQREEDEKKEAVDREKKRIQTSKDISEIKRKTEEEEVKKLVAERKREKKEDKLARERVKQEIARDREARKLKFGMPIDTPTAPVVQTVKSAAPPKEYDTAKLQIRFPSGTPLIHEFSSKEPLANVRLWISLNRQDGETVDAGFNLATTFPRKIFSEEDMEKPLNVLGLVPTSVLILTAK